MNRQSNTASSTPSTPASRDSISARIATTTALVAAALQARQSWLADSNRWLASAAFEKGRSETCATLTATSTSGPQTINKILIPELVLASMLDHVDAVCISFLSTFDEQADGVKYSDGEVDSACQALGASLTRPLARIISLNGSLPAPALDQLFDSL